MKGLYDIEEELDNGDYPGKDFSDIILQMKRSNLDPNADEIFEVGDCITYDKFIGSKLKIKEIKGDLYRGIINTNNPDDFINKKYLQKGITWFVNW